MTHSSDTTRSLADRFADEGNPNGWFEEYYTRTNGDLRAVHWADFVPGPWLISWTASHPPQPDVRAVVVECNTIQALRGEARGEAVSAIAELVAPGGSLLVSCRSRETQEFRDVLPLPLHRHELDGFVRHGLEEIHFESYDDHQDPPVPHVFAVYHRVRGD